MRTPAVAFVAVATACGGNRPAPVGHAPEAVAPPPLPVAVAEQDAAPPEDAVARIDDGTVLLEGTSEVPGALRARLRPYLEVRSAALADLGDRGERVLIKTRFGDTSQLHLVAEPLGARTQLTFRGEPIANGLLAPAGDRAILCAADEGGDEQHQIYYRAPGDTRMLTDGDSRNISMRLSRDRRWLAYSSTTRNGVDFDVWISDGRDPASARRVVEARGYWRPLDWSPDDSRLLVSEYLSASQSRVHLVDVASGKLTALTPETPPSANELAVFSKTGDSIYLTSSQEGEFKELYEVDLAEPASWRPLTRHIPWDVESIALSADGKTLAFVVNVDGYGELRLLDTRTRKDKVVKGIPKGLVQDLAFARKENVLGMTLSGPTRVGDVYTYDVRRGKLTRWTESEMGGLDTATLVEPTLIRYVTFDGAEIPALYYRPPGTGPFPVVIQAHGGPEGQSRPRFFSTAQALVAELGAAVLCPNVRGSSGYGKTYLLLDNGMKREDSVRDVGALLSWIALRPELDHERVAITGGSYGGYMVLASLVHFGDRLAAGVDVVGISSFVTFLENTSPYRRDLRRAEYGDERDPEMRALLQRASPLTRAAEIRSALFVAQGANDPRVPASEAEQIVSAVRRAGQPVWYMLARNEGHGFRRKENRDTFEELQMLFLQQHLTQQREVKSR